MIDIKDKIVEMFAKEIEGLDVSLVYDKIEIPPDQKMGDFALPMFIFAKQLKKSPQDIAKDMVEKLEGAPYFSNIVNVGPYVNFFVDNTWLAKNLLELVIKNPEGYGGSDMGKGKTVIVEFSSPNIAKPFHIGHIRSTVIGHSLYKIYDFLGYDSVSINHLGDYGTQFGMLITAYKHWGEKELVESDPIPELLKLYVRINQEAETDDTLREESRQWFKKLEEQDEEALALWKWFREVSLDEFHKVYDLLGITFDSYAGESFYSDKMPAVVESLKEKNLLEESDGALVVDLQEKNMPPAMIVKSDGSTIYTTRDIAAAIYRKEHYDFYKNIYVVGSQQILHFKSWIRVVELMGYDWAKDCVHVPFGMVSLEDGTLSTRRGKVLFLEDVLNQAIDNARKIIEERGSHIDDTEELAKTIGIGAVVFQELFSQRIKDYVFNWDRALSFEGETGPYVQYTHARIQSLLDKGGFDSKKGIEASVLLGDAERNLLQLIYRFPQVVIDAHERYEPFFVTRHVVEVAKAFNTFYNQTPINVEEEVIRNTRLALAFAAKTVIKNGLDLLGIKAPDRM